MPTGLAKDARLSNQAISDLLFPFQCPTQSLGFFQALVVVSVRVGRPEMIACCSNAKIAETRSPVVARTDAIRHTAITKAKTAGL